MPAVLITGVGRRASIPAACAVTLARAGWDVGLTCWRPYDREHGPTSSDDEPLCLVDEIRQVGVNAVLHQADFADPQAPAALFDELADTLGPLSALVIGHARDIELPLGRASAGEFDLHFAVNARSVALLIQQFVRGLHGEDGRIVAFTSDALGDNVPYGVSKGALDRIVLAAAAEFADRGIRANCINPGPTETGWIPDELRQQLVNRVPLGRLSTTQDSANLVAFLLSPEGGWVSGQVLHSDGGIR